MAEKGTCSSPPPLGPRVSIPPSSPAGLLGVSPAQQVPPAWALAPAVSSAQHTLLKYPQGSVLSFQMEPPQ